MIVDHDVSFLLTVKTYYIQQIAEEGATETLHMCNDLLSENGILPVRSVLVFHCTSLGYASCTSVISQHLIITFYQSDMIDVRGVMCH